MNVDESFQWINHPTRGTTEHVKDRNIIPPVKTGSSSGVPFFEPLDDGSDQWEPVTFDSPTKTHAMAYSFEPRFQAYASDERRAWIVAHSLVPELQYAGVPRPRGGWRKHAPFITYDETGRISLAKGASKSLVNRVKAYRDSIQAILLMGVRRSRLRSIYGINQPALERSTSGGAKL